MSFVEYGIGITFSEIDDSEAFTSELNMELVVVAIISTLLVACSIFCEDSAVVGIMLSLNKSRLPAPEPSSGSVVVPDKYWTVVLDMFRF